MNRRGLRRAALWNLAGVPAVCAALATLDGFRSTAAALPQWFMVSLGVVSLIVGCSAFVIVGGRYLTPSSVIFFGWAVLFAFPLTYLALHGALRPESSQAAVSLTLVFLAMTLILPGRRPGRVQVESLTGFLLRYRRSILILALAIAVPSVATLEVPLVQMVSRWGLIASAFAIFAVGTALLSRRRRLSGGASVAAVLVLVGIWFVFVFNGFGRINVGAIGLAFLCVWCLWFPSIRTKMAIVFTLPVGLSWGGAIRTAAPTREVWLEGSGLQSVMAPIITFGELIQRGSRAGFWAWLEQGVASVLFWVPRQVWPSKPEGFGRLMVYELRPHLSDTGVSMAASWLGEGFAYAGPIGVLIMTVMMVLLVKFLESLFWRGAAGSTPRDLFCLILGTWGGVQLLTFMWAGGFSFAGRTGGLLIGLSILCIMIWLWRSSGLRGLGSRELSYRRSFSLDHGVSGAHGHGASDVGAIATGRFRSLRPERDDP